MWPYYIEEKIQTAPPLTVNHTFTPKHASIHAYFTWESESYMHIHAYFTLHLGNQLGPCLTKEYMLRCIHSFIKRVNLLGAKFKFCISSKKYVLVRYYCMSLYSCQLWDLDGANIQLFYTAWRMCIRRIFHLHLRTHDKLLRAICQNDIRKVLCDSTQSFFRKGGSIR